MTEAAVGRGFCNSRRVVSSRILASPQRSLELENFLRLEGSGTSEATFISMARTGRDYREDVITVAGVVRIRREIILGTKGELPTKHLAERRMEVALAKSTASVTGPAESPRSRNSSSDRGRR